MCHLQGGEEAGALCPTGHHVVSDTQGPGLEEVGGLLRIQRTSSSWGLLPGPGWSSGGRRECRVALALSLLLFSFSKLLLLLLCVSVSMLRCGSGCVHVKALGYCGPHVGVASLSAILNPDIELKFARLGSKRLYPRAIILALILSLHCHHHLPGQQPWGP